MAETGGERDPNRHGAEGRTTQRQVSRARYQRHTELPDLALSTPPSEYRAVPLEDMVLLGEAAADLGRFRSTGAERSMARYVKRRAELVFSSAYLEGNTFTLPEAYTLLEGRTPAGKSTGDVDQILDLTEASERLLDLVADGTFRLDLDISDEVNGILAQHEALDAGVRRIHPRINSDGRDATVNIMGDVFHGPDRAALADAECVLAERTAAIGHPVLRAVNYAGMTSYLQMYFDGNKRTARYMMDGELMRHGFDAVAIPAARAPDYQDALAEMFRSGDTSPYALFLLDVAHRGDPVDG